MAVAISEQFPSTPSFVCQNNMKKAIAQVNS